jgi:hypothetical protein
MADQQKADPQKSVNYYKLLGVRYSASPQDIRRAYREMSKLYHPDTTELPPAIATEKFQLLNEAYGTLSSPEKRRIYDLEQGYSRVAVVQSAPDLRQVARKPSRIPRSSAYLDPSDRPLSPGEIFALFILGLTFVACLILVITIGVSRGEFALQTLNPFQKQAPSMEMPTVERLDENTLPPAAASSPVQPQPPAIPKSPSISPPTSSPQPIAPSSAIPQEPALPAKSMPEVNLPSRSEALPQAQSTPPTEALQPGEPDDIPDDISPRA